MTEILRRIQDLAPGERAEVRQRMWDRGFSTPLEDARTDAPASFTQRRLVFLQHLNPGSHAYNSAVAYRLTGRLDFAALEHALNDLLARHAALRTVLREREGEIVQHVLPVRRRSLPLVDLTRLSGDAAQRECDRLAAAEQCDPFDLAAGPLVRFRLLRLSPSQCVLLTTFHHAVVDGWSLGVFTRDLAALYEARLSGEPDPLPQLPLDYAQYARWQRDWLESAEARRQLDSWEQRLATAPDLLPLPVDRPRPAAPTFRGDISRFTVPPAVRERLAETARAGGATLFMVLLTAFAAVLSKYSGQDEVIVGTPVAGRRYRVFHDLIGFFANSVPLRVRTEWQLPFDQLLTRVRAVCLDAYEHQDLPLDVLAERLHPDRDAGRNPLYQVNLTLHNTPDQRRTAPGLALDPVEVRDTGARFDLDLNVHEGDGGLDCRLGYALDLFDPRTADRIAGSLRVLLEAVAADPSARVADLPVMDPREQARVLDAWNRTAVPRDGELRVHRLIAEKALAAPDAVAVTDPHGGVRLTYRELDGRANGLAHRLRATGARRGAVVAVLLPHSPDAVIALLAILKAGAAFLALDPGHPSARLEHLLRDSGATLLVSDAVLAKRLDTASVTVLTTGPGEDVAEPPDCDVHPDDPMYLMYTSGSTGGPKAAVLSHRNVVNYLLWAAEEFEAHEDTGVPVHSSPAFDLVVTSLFVPLLVGGRLVLLAESGVPGEALAASARTDEGFAFAKLTPSHLRLLPTAEIAGRTRPWARTLVIGGEDLREELLTGWRTDAGAGAGPVRLVNEYGPTETAVACSAFDATGRVAASGRVPIGMPIHNTRLYVLDADLRPLPVGAPGELYVGGAGVCHGYRGRAALTAQRFLPDPFDPRPGGRLYRTGDLVRRLADGNLEYLGRLDGQLKIRGHRVEPGEIESALEEVPGVRQAVVDADDDGLAAFIAVEADTGAQDADGRVAQWRDLYQDTYADLSGQADPSFKLAGWNDSQTGEPIDPAQMRSWLDGAVQRIRALWPHRLLEIGCGTGMVLSRIAPQCSHYRGTDLSPAAIDYVRGLPAGRGAELHAAPAHESVAAGDCFDTVVINSVVQYFPSVGYLLVVIEQAVRAIPAGGHLFIGDVRNLLLLDTFYARVQGRRARPGAPAGQVRAQIRRRADSEEELCLDPRLFADLPGLLPRISAARVPPKRDKNLNELSCYRYDVVLEIEGAAAGQPAWLDWTAGGLSLPAVEERLAARPASLALGAVPNARLSADLEFGERLAAARNGTPVGDLLARGAASGRPGLEPELFWQLAERHPYRVELSWARGHRDGAFDVVLTRDDEPVGAPPATTPPGRGLPRPAASYANDPLWHAAAVAKLPAIKRHLAERLPSALVPSHYVPLRAIPLARSGKADRAALRDLLAAEGDPSAGGLPAPAAPVARLTATQQRVAAIWGELLGRDGIRAEDDFFDLGGHSLLTFQLVFRLRKEFDVDVPIRAPFDASTLAAQAALVDEHRGGARDPETQGPDAVAGAARPELVPQRREPLMPASFAQERLWFLQQLEPDGIQYNFPIFLRLTGPLDPRALRQALDELTRRHEVLRTTLVASAGRPFQRVWPHSPVPLPVVDLAGLADAERAAHAAHLARQQFRRPFDLAGPPIVRAALLRLAADEHVFLLTLHHVTVDGWSAGLLLDELAELYRARSAGRASRLPEPAVQYADYAVWQRRLLDEGHLEKSREYWRRRLDGILALPGLTADGPRPATSAHTRRAARFSIPAHTTTALRALCRQEDGTLFTALLAAVYALMHLRTGETDLVVGTDVAGRSDTATERLIGFFVNQLVLRADFAGDPTWRELLRRTRSLVLDAFAHQDLPFEEVVKQLNPPRTGNQSPLFGVKVVLNNTARGGLDLPGVAASPFGTEIIETSRFDVAVLLTERDGRVEGIWECDGELFGETSAQQLPQQYTALVASMAEQPDLPVSHTPLHRRAARGGTAPRPSMRARAAGPRRAAPTPVTLTADDAVVREAVPEAGLPLVIRAARDDIDAAGWAAAGRDALDADLKRHGALLFRGFDITTPEALERFALVFVDELFRDNGEHPRASVRGGVYSPTFFAPTEKLLWHNENSFNDRGPARIWFCCARPAQEGGETPIVDSRAVYRRLDPALRAEFAAKQVMYVRTYGSGVGLHWRDVFRTDNREEVEARCAREGLRLEWRGDRLRTTAVRPAVLRHPATGEWSWFNQAQHWHTACLSEATRASLPAAFAPDELPRSCFFGDGSAIPDEAMAEICRVYQELEVSFAWQRGDVLMLDNILTAHARNPFRGERELLVSMGDMVSYR